MNLLGYTVSAAGVATDKSKVKAVEEWDTPHKLSEIQSFLGTVNYYHKFITDLAHIAAPLTNLTKKNVKFLW